MARTVESRTGHCEATEVCENAPVMIRLIESYGFVVSVPMCAFHGQQWAQNFAARNLSETNARAARTR